MKNFKLLVLGLITGFFAASLGIGGGLIMVPALTLFFRYEIKKAIGTSLATIVPTTFIGAVSHYIIKSSNTKFFIASLIIIGAVIGAKFGAELANRIESKTLKRLFALLLLFVGLKLTGIINIPTGTISDITANPLLIILGLAAGSVAALFGVGGGIIIVPMLNLFFALSIHEAIATSLAVIPFATLSGAIFHKKFNNIDTEAIKFLIPTALIAAIFGAIAANFLPSTALKLLCGIFVILCSIKLFLETKNYSS